MVHGPPSVPMKPALHVQSVRDKLPTTDELEPAAHGVQALLPAVSLYLPGSHASHGPPSTPVKPASSPPEDAELSPSELIDPSTLRMAREKSSGCKLVLYTSQLSDSPAIRACRGAFILAGHLMSV